MAIESEQVSSFIEGLADWRGKVLARLRRLIRDAGPTLVEEWKWNTPVWSQGGNVVSVGAFKDHVKVNFFKGALVDDPRGVFNAGLDAKASRAIDIHEGDRLDEAAFKALVRSAVALHDAKPSPTPKSKSKPKPTAASKRAAPARRR